MVASLCAAKPVQAELLFTLSWDRLQDKMETGHFRICFIEKKLYKLIVFKSFRFLWLTSSLHSDPVHGQYIDFLFCQ